MIKIGKWELGKSQESNPQDSRNEPYDNQGENNPEKKENDEIQETVDTPEEEPKE